jgi:AcrR family transcriptional regulator
VSTTPDTPTTSCAKPQRADARRNRERIVEAAMAVFSESGLDTQMDDLARRAGLGVGTLYRHFPTKDDLVRAVIVHHMGAMAEEARVRLETQDADPWEAFSTFLLTCAERHERQRLLSQVLATQPSSWFRHAAVVETELADRASQLLARAQADGTVRPDARGDDIPVIMCGLSAVLQTDWGTQAGRRYMQLVLDGLRAHGSDPLPA